jgi:hypothetical protein
LLVFRLFDLGGWVVVVVFPVRRHLPPAPPSVAPPTTIGLFLPVFVCLGWQRVWFDAA